MKNRTSGRFSCNHLCTGSKPANIGAQTGSVCLFASSAKPIVGVCEEPMPPTILAMAEGLQIQLLDRKSTRLNSSHLVISYAVFCLKKKKEHYSSRSVY